MNSHDRYKSSIGFTDMLLNLLVGFVFLFIIAFILINPITKKSDIPTKAEFLFIMEWDEELNDDIDLWIRDPNGVVVSYMNKEGGLLNLEKDDLGSANDSYVDEDGNTQIIKINREVITMRGIVPGKYTVFAHVYSRRSNVYYDENENKWISVNADTYSPIFFTLLKVNPFSEVWRSEHRYIKARQEIPLVEFELDADGNASNFSLPRQSIITGSRISSVAVDDSFVAGGRSTGRRSTPRPAVDPALQGATSQEGLIP